jgi:hypothetical protein
LTPTGNISFVPDRFNVANKAVYLNKGYFTLPSGVYITSTQFSLMGWLYLYNTKLIFLFQLGNGYNRDHVQYYAQDGYLQVGFFNADDSKYDGVPSANVLTLKTWIHTAFTFDGSHLKVYINGILQGSGLSTFMPRNVLRVCCYLCVESYFPINNYAPVQIDDLRIYDSAINQSTIQAIMNLS